MFGPVKPQYRKIFERELIDNINTRNKLFNENITKDLLMKECLMYSLDMCLEFYDKSDGSLTQDWIEHITTETGTALSDNYIGLFTLSDIELAKIKVSEYLKNINQSRNLVDKYYRRTKLKFIEDIKNGNNNPVEEIIAYDFNDHVRYQNGIDISGNNYNCNREIEIKKNTNGIGYILTIYNLDGQHPIWGNNIQMAPKIMMITKFSENYVRFDGFGTDVMGNKFSDYSIELFFSKIEPYVIDRFKLHMIDRNIMIEYFND